MVIFSGHGQEIIFEEITEGGQLTVATSSRDLEFVFIFDLSPISTVEAVNNHIQLGTLLNHGGMRNIVLPPPSWAFGHHITLPSGFDNQDLSTFLEGIETSTGFPYEGIVMQRRDLDKEKSFTLNTDIFTSESIDWITA